MTPYQSVPADRQLSRTCRTADNSNSEQPNPSEMETAVDSLTSIAHRRKAAHARLMELDSKVYKAFLAMEQAAFTDGDLSRKHKELVAVGISVAKDCESCMQWHVEQAARAGATYRELLEAVEVAIEMGGGRATVSARFALEVMDAVFAEA